ncbi:3-hydroxyisobutyrate dehydrogenase [Hyaloscypha variabilis F]|uniref:3-hydroxyisobutyrate dehydrogenase n=1 Tax=Hyaloscypha variabilis (strain UAMH 11265 / GT02V1 / F) TaxID=1149755 RepID=A0A2J6RJC1_HYAVF|nr:3-hydroxyisobutyrate dehydrogenase [Hyaloscypha variabilis F]
MTSTKVAFVGLGAMGFGMASHLVKKGYDVIGYDVYKPTCVRFQQAGGRVAQSPREAALEAKTLICMVTSSQQVDSVLFDSENGAVEVLPLNASIIICSTVQSAYLTEIRSRLDCIGRNDISLVDSPVSGGTVRAAKGTLTILVSASPGALRQHRGILSDLSEKLFIIPGGIGAASNVKMVNQLLAGVHIAAAAEAMGLAVRMGLNTRRVYEIIVNAAGNSWMFENRVPHMLDNDWTPRSALDIFVKDMGIVTSSARLQGFPLPLASAAEQLYLSASLSGYGKEDDSGLVRLFTPGNESAVHDNGKLDVATEDRLTPTLTPNEIKKVGFIGLGAMGLGMATSLIKGGFQVSGYDLSPKPVLKFLSAGGKAEAANSPTEAASHADIVVLMVQAASQVEDVLFGSGNVAERLPIGAVVIISSTIAPSFARKIDTRLRDLGKDLCLVDAPVSGGVAKAAEGLLTIICSATKTAMSKATPVLLAMSGKPENIYFVGGGVGAASSVKLINQLLAGVHIVAAAEAIAFGAKMGLETQKVYEIIKNAAGGSWMFENRVPAMLSEDWTPHSMLAIFVKDLSIVLDESKRLGFPASLTAAAHQTNLMGASYGWAQEADGGIVRLWELITGVSVSKSARPQEIPFTPREYPKLPLNETLDALPAEYEGDVLRSIKEQISDQKTPLLVILDDDPTGTQTCHDISVLTVWDIETLQLEFKTAERGFFILTNSRAFPPKEAKKLVETICQNIQNAAQATGKTFEIVLRGDSTLRGHFPEEPETVEAILGKGNIDAWILAPFFYQGGRYTINDVHYVAEGDTLVPASQTPFARDATFGYKSSNLRDYVLEKAGSKFTVDDFVSISIEDIRLGIDHVTEKLLKATKGSVVIVNAAAETDMHVFAAGILAAEQKGRKYICRTGAAFVSSRLGITGIPPLSAESLNINNTTTGGLIIAGSYVPKTTLQLQSLRTRRASKLYVIELPVAKLIHSLEAVTDFVSKAVEHASQSLQNGQDVLIMTSRDLVVGQDPVSSLGIGGLVAEILVRIMLGIEVRPRYVIAKGGITSSDMATKGLKMKRAVIVGQAAAGVPLWKCDEGTSRHRGVPFVVFPGNVGGENTLAELVERWALPKYS